MATPGAGPIFDQDAKTRIRKALKRIIKQLTPADLGAFTLENYIRALLDYLQRKPYMLAGELYEDRKVASGRVMIGYSMASENWQFIKSAVRELVKELRFQGGAYNLVSTRILPADAPQWVDWRTTDCVFAALLYLIGYRFAGSGANIEGVEKDLSLELATQLQIPGKVVQDQVLLILMEDRLQWTRMPVKNRQELDSQIGQNAIGRMYIITYCSNAQTDFWHTVLAERTGDGWEVIDRQSMRTTGRPLALGNGECNAWRVNTDSNLFQQVRTHMRNLATNNPRYRQYLTA